MLKSLKFEKYFTYLVLIIFSFTINYYVASRGVFPVDTFMHYDSGFKILLEDLPVRDYWIVHGFLIDYIQSVFFYLFGANWNSYIIHSSIFNVIISISTYLTLTSLKIKNTYSIVISLLVSLLAYPVSGSPFLDLHAAYFSLIAIYILIFSILKRRDLNWFFVSFLLCVAFFCKQVPSAYTIVGISLYAIFYSIQKKTFKFISLYLFGIIIFLILFILFLKQQNISLREIVLQLFLFPQSIGLDRYENYNLNLKNIFLDFKFIYLFLLPIICINFFKLIKFKNYYESENLQIFLIISIFTLSLIFHQIYTKNQIYIFFLIPLLAGFLIYFIELTNLNRKNIICNILIIICIVISLKYHLRFNLERKFHELTNTDISKSVDASLFNKKFSGLKWISPHFKNPEEELKILKKFQDLIQSDIENKIVISEYNFFSSILNEKLYSLSRTYDDISYPLKDSKYFYEYKSFVIKKIKTNNIKSIYILHVNPLSEKRYNQLLFDYVSKNCFESETKNNFITYLKIKNCKELL